VRVSFVFRGPSAPVPDDLVEFYRTLPKRPKTPTSDGSPTDLWVHQGEITRAYAPALLDHRDVALQLPTGAGKTLVGGLIAEWRRRKRGERVVLACPTRQLAAQTVTKLDLYGIESILLIGKQRTWSQAARTRYSSAQAIAAGAGRQTAGGIP
jgi:superfamily II DNA or RNA helicase